LVRACVCLFVPLQTAMVTRNANDEREFRNGTDIGMAGEFVWRLRTLRLLITERARFGRIATKSHGFPVTQARTNPFVKVRRDVRKPANGGGT